jgi:hypothetical protein
MKSNERSGIGNFDFLIGSWRVRHRRLKQRLANNHDWIEFEGTCVTRKILGGAGNIDEHFLELPEGSYHALAVRTYDRTTNDWSIWWFDGRYPNRLDPPVVGRFDNEEGTFHANDMLNDQPIRIRFLWTNLNTEPRWEQSFSDDDGKTWEVNWVMEFVRDHVGSGRS